MPTGHSGALTFGTSGITLDLISLSPGEETIADVAEPHLGLSKGDHVPYTPGDLVEGGQYSAVFADDHQTNIDITNLNEETITWTKPLQSGGTTAASRSFDGYINSVQYNEQATDERATITVGIKVAGDITFTAAT